MALWTGNALPRHTAHLLHKATPSSPGDVDDILNTLKQMQTIRQNEEIKKHLPNKIANKTSEKELNEMKISNLSDQFSSVQLLSRVRLFVTP